MSIQTTGIINASEHVLTFQLYVGVQKYYRAYPFYFTIPSFTFEFDAILLIKKCHKSMKLVLKLFISQETSSM